jgi:hypothetical protein
MPTTESASSYPASMPGNPELATSALFRSGADWSLIDLQHGR